MKATRVINMRGRGGIVPAGAIYIGRAMPRLGLAGSPWANPFHIPRDGTREEVIAKYEAWLETQPDLLERIPELKGKTLACWCAPDACHGDVLARLADGLSSRARTRAESPSAA